MLTAFSTALSALNADSTAVDVVGNNLANLNTTGFKASEVSFSDLVNEALSAAHNAAGFGVSPAQITQIYSQGSIQTSTGPYDSAISGSGFYLLKDQNGNQLYTRDGNFTVNAQGDLVTQGGQNVQGWEAVNGVVNTSGAVSNLVVPLNTLNAPVATTNFSASVNLDASAPTSGTGSSFSVPVQTYDSLGNPLTITVSFQKTAANAWGYTATIPASALSSTSTTTNPLATGTLNFDSSGTLQDPSVNSNKAPINIPITGLADGASNLSINWNLFDPSTGAPNISQFSQTSAQSSVTADGSPAGSFSNVTIGSDGTITANYSTGKPVVLGQLALASITDPETLADTGAGNLALTTATGQPSIGTAGTGGRGTIVPDSLESSTVDIATEFTNLIVFQRSYEANGKVITTADQLSQDTIALKTT